MEIEHLRGQKEAADDRYDNPLRSGYTSFTYTLDCDQLPSTTKPFHNIHFTVPRRFLRGLKRGADLSISGEHFDNVFLACLVARRGPGDLCSSSAAVSGMTGGTGVVAISSLDLG